MKPSEPQTLSEPAHTVAPTTEPKTTSRQDAQNNIPWVEKYRPQKFEEIVLDPINRTIFRNVLDKNYFPNLLFYGPPGTGKTTTIINLINEYQRRYFHVNNATVIHLNASDERGIDIIRNQIYQFVKSKNMFEKGLKFVILDEVDYMTKNAQQALKYLLQSSSYNVRFCLICNYISKIDESLKNEFIAIRFNQLPTEDIRSFIRHVVDSEYICMSDEVIATIHTRFQSDIRSMINFIQLNQHMDIVNWNENIITDDISRTLHSIIKGTTKDRVRKVLEFFHQTSQQYNIDKLNILKMYFHYLIRREPAFLNRKVLDIMENVLHIADVDIQTVITYVVANIEGTKVFRA